MKIDCATCPARQRACDGCLMQVLFSPATRDFGPESQWAETDDDLLDAIDVFVDTALISRAAARAARSDIAARQTGFTERSHGRLRAV